MKVSIGIIRRSANRCTNPPHTHANNITYTQHVIDAHIEEKCLKLYPEMNTKNHKKDAKKNLLATNPSKDLESI